MPVTHGGRGLRRFFGTLATACVLLPCSSAFEARAATEDSDAALAVIQPAGIRADMRFLSDDLLEGRGTGSRGHRLAAQFAATQFEAMGLAPAGDTGTYFQDVPLQSQQLAESGASFTWTHAGKSEVLKFREDYVLYGDAGRDESRVMAPVVFVGFGVSAPEQGYDDYKNVDVKGKIVAMVFGAPDFQSAVKAHYSTSSVKRKMAADHGAVGILLFYEPRLQSLYPFEKVVRDLAIPRYNWLDADGRPDHYYPSLKAFGAVSLAGVAHLLAGSGHTPEQIAAGAKAGKLSPFALPATAELHVTSKREPLHSPNVVARLEGSDPTLKSEYVVYSAHLDHLGISTAENGDSIYNGAVDNASGSAEVLEIARAFSRLPTRPRRSILFVAVTAEEAGLLGSDYFATNPTVPRGSIVANINIDEDVMLWPLHDVVAFGSEHSTLAGVVQRAGQRLQLQASPDPMPEQVAFVRSDQYSFVRQGIPSLSLFAGFKSDDPNVKPAEIFEHWVETTYHQPQDELRQPGLNFEAAAEFARVGFLCGLYVAQDTGRPQWNPGDFFGTLFAPKGH